MTTAMFPTVLAGICLLLAATAGKCAPPANDAFTNRLELAIPETSLTVTGSNLEATREPGEPAIYHGLGRTVWYAWRATRSGPVSLDAVSPTAVENFGVYVFTGDALEELQWGNTFSFWQEGRRKTLFDARAGTTYALLVEKVEWPFFGPGDFVLQMDLVPPPANDHFAGRLPLAGRAAVAMGSTLGATREADDPVPDNPEGVHSVWWTWTAPGTGTATVAGLEPAGLPHGSGFHPTLGIYTGQTLNSLVEVTNNWRSQGPATDLDFPVTAGTVYHFLIAAKSGERSPVAFTLTLDGASLLTSPRAGPAGDVHFELVGAPWQFYRIESATHAGDWRSVSNVHCIYQPVPLSFPREAGDGGRFFRAVLQPE